jgi:hypothetical protein
MVSVFPTEAAWHLLLNTNLAELSMDASLEDDKENTTKSCVLNIEGTFW